MKFNRDDIKRILNSVDEGFIEDVFEVTDTDVIKFNSLATAFFAERVRINSIDDELAEGKAVATRLAEHLDRMRAQDASFVVDVDSIKYNVKVERAYDETNSY